MQTALTHGIKVSVESFYQAQQSNPLASHYVFAYRISIVNESDEVIVLRRRHWYITDSTGEHREVEGEGVVGEQPQLKPGEAFVYVSGCNFNSEFGKMHGTYLMERINNNSLFEVKIPEFQMAFPYRLN